MLNKIKKKKAPVPQLLKQVFLLENQCSGEVLSSCSHVSAHLDSVLETFVYD